MLEPTEVLIVGGGVVGLTTAYLLVTRGWEVKILEARTPGQESSWAGGGILSPVPPWAYKPWVEASVKRSRTLWREWITEIEALSGVSCEYWESGLMLSGDPHLYPLVSQAQEWLKSTDEPFEQGCRADFDPRLPQPDWPALLLPAIPQVRNPRLMQSLSVALSRLGVTMAHSVPIECVRQRRNGGTAVIAQNGDEHRAAHVIIAAGAWTDQILAASGLEPLGITPKLGQMLLYQCPKDQIPRHIINTGAGYLIPRLDGKVLVGSSVEDRGFNYAPTREVHQRLVDFAQETWPLLTSDKLRYHWTGFRPGINVGRPAVGCAPGGWPGLWVNAGHFRNGLGLAPACAEHLAQAMA